MGKRLIQFVFSFVLCSILILVLESIAFADQESDFTCSFENGQAIITGYHGQGGDVTIPDTIQGCPVVEVAYNAFDSCNSIKSITFPDSVVKIDNYAFFNCNQMTSFYVNESNPVLSSQDGVLYSKDKKTLLFYPPGRKGEFTIPNGVEDIASSSFPYCIGLTQVTIPDSVVNIERESFMHCTGLRYINIPNGISIINEMSFYYCVNLQNVYFPDSVKEIEYSAFENCDQLTDIVITKNIDYVDPSSFRECDNLVDINVDPDNQNYTSQDGVLYNKEKSVLICFPAGKGGQFIMPDSLTSFYNFYMCNKLTHIKLSNNLTEINSGAFQRCSNLCTIDIPDRAICFDDNAVLDCNSLKKLIFPGYMPTISSISFDSDVVLYYDIIYASSWHASDNMKYEKQPYCIVTVNLLDDSTPIQVMVNLNNNYLVSEPSAPSKNNYSFSGWYKNPDYSAEWDFQNDQINTDITLYAKWTPITYTISFNSQGGSDVLPILGSYNTSIEKPTVPEREGYQFSGWFREQTCKTQWDFSTDVVIGNITLYAQWVADKILVTLNYQDGVTSPVSILVTYGSVYGLQKPLRPGYSFNGWYIDTDDTGTEIQSNTKVTTTSPQTLYAKWTANQYTVKLDAQGGTVVPGSKAVTFDSTYGQLPKPYDRTGYIFEGWYPGKNGSGMQVTDSTPVTITADQTLYASWTANIYHVTFEYQDMVTSPTIGQVSYDSTYKDVLPDPKRSGYDFGGWYTAPNGTGDRISSNTTVTITSDLLLYAKWIAKSFKITLDFQDKATPSAIIWVTFGSTYGEQLKSLFRIGYKFNGWYPGINGSGVKVTESTLVTITDDQ